MDAWYLQQRQREKELRERRREAEALLRGYRGGRESLGGMSTTTTATTPAFTSSQNSFGFDNATSPHLTTNDEDDAEEYGEVYPDPTHPSLRASTSASESLDDPRSFHSRSMTQQPQNHRRFPGGKDGGVGQESLRASSSEEAVALKERGMQEGEREPSHSNDVQATPSDEHSVEVTVWSDFIEHGGRFPPAAGRYHLYLSYACPGSHRALIVRALKGLENVVSVTFVHPTWRLTNPDDPDDKHRGWVFGNPDGEPFTNTIQRGGPFPPAYTDTEPDPLFNAYSIRQIYEHAGDTSGKYTVPLLWDTVHNTIVNNESSDIAYMLNSSFNDFCLNPDLDIYTEYDEDGVAKLNEVTEWLSPLMIHGVYRCGFAKNQRAYDKAIAELCEAFDRADDILQQQRYLTGNDTLTDADIRLFVSLLRFDEVYAIYFKANARLVMLTPSLLNFCREIYQIPGIAETCKMDQIKAHFYGSHAEWNKYSVICKGLGFMELLDMPHDRHLLTDFYANDDDHLEYDHDEAGEHGLDTGMTPDEI
jgi:glutathionyl-hydroquinone reductase